MPKWLRDIEWMPIGASALVLAAVLLLVPEPTPQDQGISSAEQNAGEITAPRSADERLADYTLGLEILTGFLVAVTTLQAALFVWQLRYMRKGVEDTAEAASAATKQARLAQQTFESVERPYIFIYGIEWDEDRPEDVTTDPDDIFPFFRFMISSEGKLPAVMDFIGITVNIGNGPAPSMELKEWGNSTTKIMRPGTIERRTGAPAQFSYERQINFSVGEYGPDLLVPVLTEGNSVYVEILVQYHGPFSKGHETRASWWWWDGGDGSFSENPDPKRTYMS